MIVKQETKRYETSRNETKRDTTETKQDKAEIKRNETKKKNNINKLKNETNINETIFFSFRLVSCFTVPHKPSIS